MKRKTCQNLKKKAKIWKNIVDKNVFIDYLYDGNLNAICNRIEKFRGVIMKLRDYRWLEEIEYGYSPDIRSGDETYGYESLDGIDGSLTYVSDRCHAAFRLTWLLELPERVALLRNNK
jgi:hypothetical protein